MRPASAEGELIEARANHPAFGTQQRIFRLNLHGLRGGRPSPRAIAVAQKRAEAMKHRLQGRTFEQIGIALGVTAGRAYQLVDEALAATLREPAEQLRKLELVRLEAAIRAVYPRVVKGDMKAIDALLKIMDRQARPLGLYA
jgi:hypothetical protein